MANYKSLEPCQACGIETEDGISYHHIYSRGAYPELAEKVWNKIPLCDAKHHVPGIHRVGTREFAEQFSTVKEWLIRNEWFLDEFSGKWMHEKK